MPLLIHILVLIIPLLVVTALPYPHIFPKAITFFLLIEILILYALTKILVSKTQRVNIPRSLLSPLFASIALFIIAALLAAAFGVDPIRSFFSDQIRMSGIFMLLHAAVWLLLLCFFLQHNSNQWRSLSIASTFTAFVVGLYVVAQKFALFPGWTLQLLHDERVTSTLGNPLYLGHYLLLSIWIAALTAAHEKSVVVRRILYAFIPFAYFNILLTGNRSTVAIATAGILFFALYSLRKKYIPKIYLTIIIVVFVSLPILFVSKQFSSFWQPTFRVVRDFFHEQNRPTLWTIGIRSFLQKPFLGWGSGNFDYAYYAQVRVPEEYAVLPHGIPNNSHNTLIEILVTSGIMGVLSFFFVIIMVIWRLHSLFRRDEDRLILSGLYLSTFFLSALLQDLTIFDTPSTIILLTFGFSLLYFFSFHTYSETKTPTLSFSVPRPLIIIVLISIGAVSLFFVAMPAYASYLSKKAWHIFPGNVAYGAALHSQAIQFGSYLAPEIRQVFAKNVISAYNKTRHAYLIDAALPLALNETKKSFYEHPLSVEWITQYTTLLRIDITERGSKTSKQELKELLEFAEKQYPQYPDIRFEQLQYFLAINDLDSFHKGVSSLTTLLPSDGRTGWFVALSFLTKNDIPKTVDNLLEAERKGYDIFTQTHIWEILATRAQGAEIQRIRELLTRAVEKNPSNEGLRAALRIAIKKEEKQ